MWGTIYYCLWALNFLSYTTVSGRNRTLFCCVFHHFTVVKALAQNLLRAGLIHYIDLSGIHTSTLHAYDPPPLVGRYSSLDVIHNGMMFDFYPGLPHIYLYIYRYIFLQHHTYIYFFTASRICLHTRIIICLLLILLLIFYFLSMFHLRIRSWIILYHLCVRHFNALFIEIQ